MKASTTHTALYAAILTVAVIGAGFLAAFLGQLYAENPLLVFDLIVAQWVNGLIGWYAILIAYLAIWIIFQLTHFDSGYSAVIGDIIMLVIFFVSGAAVNAGLVGEQVYKLTCRAQPMRHDVISLCLPAAIGSVIAWIVLALIVITFVHEIIAMRTYPGRWTTSLYTLCNAKPVEPARPVYDLDKNTSRTSSFGTPSPSNTERGALMPLIMPNYPPRTLPNQHRRRSSPPSPLSPLSSLSTSPVSPRSPTSPSGPVTPLSPVRSRGLSPPSAPSPTTNQSLGSAWNYPQHMSPQRLPPGGLYAASADANLARIGSNDGKPYLPLERAVINSRRGSADSKSMLEAEIAGETYPGARRLSQSTIDDNKGFMGYPTARRLSQPMIDDKAAFLASSTSVYSQPSAARASSQLEMAEKSARGRPLSRDLDMEIHDAAPAPPYTPERQYSPVERGGHGYMYAFEGSAPTSPATVSSRSSFVTALPGPSQTALAPSRAPVQPSAPPPHPRAQAQRYDTHPYQRYAYQRRSMTPPPPTGHPANVPEPISPPQVNDGTFGVPEWQHRDTWKRKPVPSFWQGYDR